PHAFDGLERMFQCGARPLLLSCHRAVLPSFGPFPCHPAASPVPEPMNAPRVLWYAIDMRGYAAVTRIGCCPRKLRRNLQSLGQRLRRQSATIRLCLDRGKGAALVPDVAAPAWP